MRNGFSLVDLILAIGIIATLFGGIFLVYFAILDTASNFELRRAAAGILAERVEVVRTLAYEQVGVQGGIPAGVLLQAEQVDWNGSTFVVQAAVRNVDDPFDGTVTSTPADTAPADYKLVELTATCPTCARFSPIAITTTVAPRGLESASGNGSLFVSVFDANGHAVPGASVHIVNASTSPAIDFTDVTDASGRLQLVDVPTSTQAYQVAVTKDGYSSERTYAPGGTGNPNPVKPHATVSSQAVTELSFAIDLLANVTVSSADIRCTAIASQPFDATGGKLVGTSPDVPKYAFSGDTGTGGATTLPLEWDSYALAYEGSLDLVGTIPLLPAGIVPGGEQSFRFILAPAASSALQVTVRDAGTGDPLEAMVVLSGAGSAAASTSYATYRETDWDGASLSGVIAGAQVALSPEGGPYATSTDGTLESAAIDLGGTPASATHLSWSGQSNGSGPDAIRFQVAGSDTGSGWSYVGPDGSGSSYFTGPGPLPAAVQGKRYVRYRIYLSTDSPASSPTVSAVSFEFAGPCVPRGQRLFTGLASGSYTVSVTAPGRQPASVPVTVGAGWKTVSVSLEPS